MENLKELGLSINDDLIQEANELEEELIKKEILPVLSKTIEPALQPVKRELVLVVDYVPGQPLSVHLSRKRNFTAEMPDAKEIVLDPVVEHGTRNIRTDEKITKSPASRLVVTFSDGTLVDDKTAIDTLETTIRRIGVERVRSVVEQRGLEFCHIPVISNRRDDKYGDRQRDLGGGWLLITVSNNEMKKRFLDRVSEALHLNLKVELKK